MTPDPHGAIESIRAAREEESYRGAGPLQTVTDFVRFGASCFHRAGLHFGHGTADAIDEALVLVLHALHLPQPVPDEFHWARLTNGERNHVHSLFIERIEKRIPSAYITGEAWFAGLRFEVDERVLIPRSPLAEFIETRFEPWVHVPRVRRILDIGTGSGCLAIACAHAFSAAIVDAVDIDEDALEVARRNVRLHELEESVRVHHSDLFSSPLPPVNGRKRYDLIVSNPPYVPNEEMIGLEPEYRAEPERALAGGADGLDIVGRIVDEAPHWLTPDRGVLVIEIGASPVVRDAFETRFAELKPTRLEPERGGEGVYLFKGLVFSGR